MKTGGLLALPIVAGALTGVVAGPAIGLAVALGGLLATAASLIVLHPGRGRDIAAGGAVSDAAAGWAEFHRELARSRRFDRSFAIVRLAAGHGQTAEGLAGVRDRVAEAARRTDRAWVDGDDVLVLLPETSPTTAARFTERVVGAMTDVAVTPTMATFPGDGITSGALIAVAYGGEVVVPTPIGAVRPDPRPATIETGVDPVPDALGHGG
jgi:hypothetical protein